MAASSPNLSRSAVLAVALTLAALRLPAAQTPPVNAIADIVLDSLVELDHDRLDALLTA